MSLARPTLPSRLISRVRRSIQSGPAAARSLKAPEIAAARALVYFADGPGHLYQLDQWYSTLRELNRVIPTAIIVAKFETYLKVAPAAGVPVAFAASTADIERTIGRSRTKAVLYPNNNSLNFRCLRYCEPVHFAIGHGESDKGSTGTNQLRAYDYVLAPGVASRRRMRRIRFFDEQQRVIPVGRPQIDGTESFPPPPAMQAWHGDGRPVVVYAPTWEGDRPSMAYGSAASHGRELVDAIMSDGRYHLVFRPHPSSGAKSALYRTAVADIADKIERAGSEHLVDRGAYGWQVDAADYLITDVSAVAYDGLGRARPMVITLPVSADVHREDSDLLQIIPGIEAADAGTAVSALEQAQLQRNPDSEVYGRLARLRDEYFGDQTPGAATKRFVEAVTRLSGLSGE